MRTVDENNIRTALMNVSDIELKVALESMVEAARRREQRLCAKKASNYRFMEMSQGEDQ